VLDPEYESSTMPKNVTLRVRQSYWSACPSRCRYDSPSEHQELFA